jgi:SM-20-related protein
VNGDVLFLEEFFAPAEVEALWDYAMQRELEFVASEVLGGDQEGRHDEHFRRSSVLYDVAGAYPLVSERVMQCLPYVVDRLELVPFDVREIELQITASNDGEWFKAHRDSGHGTVATRELTFVYYCHREPRGFSGGELRVFGMLEDGDDPAARDRAQTIMPQQNSVAFFPSNVLHEVMPVSCPSRRFADSRLTYNGWLHR